MHRFSNATGLLLTVQLILGGSCNSSVGTDAEPSDAGEAEQVTGRLARDMRLDVADVPANENPGPTPSTPDGGYDDPPSDAGYSDPPTDVPARDEGGSDASSGAADAGYADPPPVDAGPCDVGPDTGFINGCDAS